MAKKYNWKITAKKFLWSFAEVLAAGAIAICTERGEFLFLIPVFEAVRNYTKHK